MEFFDGVFNRQAVAVPTGDVLRIKASQLAGLDDHVLEHFVEGVANVQLAIGIGRPIVQHKQGLAQARQAQFFVQTLVRPGFGPSGFAFGQVSAHGKRGVGQVQAGAVVGSGFGHIRAQTS